MLKFMACRLIPVCIEPKQCDFGRRLMRDCLFNHPLHKNHLVHRVMRTRHVGPYFIEGRSAPLELGVGFAMNR